MAGKERRRATGTPAVRDAGRGYVIPLVRGEDADVNADDGNGAVFDDAAGGSGVPPSDSVVHWGYPYKNRRLTAVLCALRHDGRISHTFDQAQQLPAEVATAPHPARPNPQFRPFRKSPPK